jgi:hypothetical protein
MEEVKVCLPHRSFQSCYNRLLRCGVVLSKRWMAKDLIYLRTYWGSVSMEGICRALGRTRAAVYRKAQELGLKLGVPQGLEGLTCSAVRMGFDPKQLRKILRWAGVKVRGAYTIKKRARHRVVVDPYEVEWAVERWNQTETLKAAARRLGIDREVLRRLLYREGVDLDSTRTVPGNVKTPFRVHSEVIDEAVERARKKKERACEKSNCG